MPRFKLSTIERWEHKVYYEEVEAESIEAAWEAINRSEVSYDESEIIESGDEVLYCDHAQQDGKRIEIPETIPQSYTILVDLPRLTPQELATVTAGLRLLVDSDLEDCEDDERSADFRDIATANGAFELMTGREVDLLVERLTPNGIPLPEVAGVNE